jgi:drug/metabolite transporter (DMT)-like permease
MGEGTIATLILVGIWGPGLLLCVWMVRRARSRQHPPMRPEYIRRLIEKRDRGISTAHKVGLIMQMLVFVVPGVLLLTLATSSTGRVLGGLLLAWPVLYLLFAAVLVWRVRRTQGGGEAARAKLLAESEAFWSQPDAEEKAREMRRLATWPFARSRRPSAQRQGDHAR